MVYRILEHKTDLIRSGSMEMTNRKRMERGGEYEKERI
jgi:hypothetical protein